MAKRGRPKKKPDYDKNEKIQEQLAQAVALFAEPYDDRKDRSRTAPSLNEVARKLGTTTIRTRKILISAGYYSTEASRKVKELHDAGRTMQEIMDATGLKDSSVYSYLPYSKGVYNLADPTLCAEHNRSFRGRRDACTNLANHLDSPDAEEYLWKAIEAFQNYKFQTTKGLSMHYTVKGGEIFFNRKEKSITRATVNKAYHKARDVQRSEGCVSGPKKLGTFGASYLYPVFIRIGVCGREPPAEA